MLNFFSVRGPSGGVAVALGPKRPLAQAATNTVETTTAIRVERIITTLNQQLHLSTMRSTRTTAKTITIEHKGPEIESPIASMGELRVLLEVARARSRDRRRPPVLGKSPIIPRT